MKGVLSVHMKGVLSVHHKRKATIRTQFIIISAISGHLNRWQHLSLVSLPFPFLPSSHSPTSPTYFCTSSDPMTRMKHASVLLATALARRVFPVPGGPNRRTPFGGSIPSFTKRSGCNVRTHELKIVQNRQQEKVGRERCVGECERQVEGMVWE